MLLVTGLKETKGIYILYPLQVIIVQDQVSYVYYALMISCLGHPWLAGHHDVKIPLDMIIYKLTRAYTCSSSLRKAALGVCILALEILIL